MANADYDGIELRFSATFDEVADAFDAGEVIFDIYAPNAGDNALPVCQGKVVGLYPYYSGALVEVPSRILFNDTHPVFEGQPESYTIMFYEVSGLPNNWMKCEFIWADYIPDDNISITATYTPSTQISNRGTYTLPMTYNEIAQALHFGKRIHVNLTPRSAVEDPHGEEVSYITSAYRICKNSEEYVVEVGDFLFTCSADNGYPTSTGRNCITLEYDDTDPNDSFWYIPRKTEMLLGMYKRGIPIVIEFPYAYYDQRETQGHSYHRQYETVNKLRQTRANGYEFVTESSSFVSTLLNDMPREEITT